MSGAYPLVDGVRQVVNLLRAGCDAQEHAGQLFFFTVAFKKVCHLAAQKKLLEHVFLAGKGFAKIGEFVTRTITGKVQQVGMVKKIIGFFTHEDGDLGRKRRDHSPGQTDRAIVGRKNGQHVIRTLPEAAQPLHINDAPLTRYKGLKRAVDLGRIAQTVQRIA